MKKQLLSILILLIMFVANNTFAQNRSDNVSTSGAHSFNKASINAKLIPSAVPSTTTSSCMSINLPTPSGWTLVNYGTGTPIFKDGFVNGPNIYNDKEKAMYFDASASANTMITQVYVGFAKAYAATPTKTVAIRFYDGTSGTPGATIGSGTLSMATIMTDVTNNQYSLIIFGTPLTLPVSKKFFASVDITALSFTTATKDSLSIVSNSDPQTTPTATWERQSDNLWYKYNSASSWLLNISLLIHPFLTQAPIAASITIPTGTLCTGQSITYNSAGSTSPGTYSWFFGAATTSTTTGVTANTSYTSAGTYTTQMVVQDACGSFGIATKTINVNLSPTANASTSQTITCTLPTANLSGSGVSTYTWTGPGITSGGNTANPTANMPGTYSLTGTTAGCISNVATVILTSNTVAPVVSIASSPTAICIGNSATLTANGANTYTWSTSSTATSIAVSPTTTTNYILTGTNTTNGCFGTTNFNLTVNNLPIVTASSPTPACTGGTGCLLGGGAGTFSWAGPCGFTSNLQAPCFPFNLVCQCAYTLTGTDANGCVNTATTCIAINPLPTVTANSTASLICVGSSVTLNGGGATTYTWSGSVSDGVTFSPTVTNTYTVTGTDVNGCMNTAALSVTVSACTGINNVSENIAQFVVYPNPNSGDFTISLTGTNKTPSVEIYNTIGKLVYKDILTAEKNNFNTNLAAGIYFINIIDNGKVIATQKLICK